MKKFFTLFALLSVGLSAWAQTYTLELLDENGVDAVFSCVMKEGNNVVYTNHKIFYFNGPEADFYYDEEEDEWYDNPGEPIDYIFIVKENNVEIARSIFTTENEEDAGWYDLSFRYTGGNTIEININEKAFQIDLNDEKTFATEGAQLWASYTRECSNQWGTICLPFEFYPNSLKNDVTFYELKSATSEALIFTPTDDLVAHEGYPYVFKLNENLTKLTIKNEQATIVIRQQQQSTDDGSWTMHGTIEETTISNGWVMQNNQIFQIDPNETAFPIKPYRAWFENPGASGAPLRIEVDETEGLQFVEQEDGTVKVSYDLQGRKLNEARKGLMIENGKVIMVK